MVLGRKHSRSGDEDSLANKNKKVKLENLLDELNLSDDTKSHISVDSKNKSGSNVFAINQRLKETPVFKKQPLTPGSNALGSSSNINAYIAEKLFAHFQGIRNSNMSMIPWYNGKFLIIYRLQRWIVRNFNRFLKKYNKHNDSRIRPFKHYDRILRLVNEGRITMPDLISIVLQESSLELDELKTRNTQRSADKQSEKIEELSDIKYNYWDTIKLDKDLEMMDEDSVSVYAENIDIQSESIQTTDKGTPTETDIDMDIDNWTNVSESNYGSYYFDYHGSSERL